MQLMIFITFSTTDPVDAEAYCGNNGNIFIFLKSVFLNLFNPFSIDGDW